MAKRGKKVIRTKMKTSINRILSGISKETEMLIKSTLNGKKITSAEESVAIHRKIQQLKNAHIMVCNAFDVESEYER